MRVKVANGERAKVVDSTEGPIWPGRCAINAIATGPEKDSATSENPGVSGSWFCAQLT